MGGMMQLYWIPWHTKPDGTEPVPGAFVFGPNSQTDTVGYVVTVESEPVQRCLICLWRPAPVHPEATVVSDHMTDEAVQAKLSQVLEKHPKMKMRWNEAMLLMWKN